MLFDGLSWLSPAVQLSCFLASSQPRFPPKKKYNYAILYYVFYKIKSWLSWLFLRGFWHRKIRLAHYTGAESNASPTGREGRRGGSKGFFRRSLRRRLWGTAKFRKIYLGSNTALESTMGSSRCIIKFPSSFFVYGKKPFPINFMKSALLLLFVVHGLLESRVSTLREFEGFGLVYKTRERRVKEESCFDQTKKGALGFGIWTREGGWPYKEEEEEEAFEGSMESLLSPPLLD